MRKVAYRGYVSRQRFNPLEIPDETQKMLYEGQRILRGMDRAQDQKEKNERAQINAIKEKSRLETSSSIQASSIANEFAQAFRDAELKNLKTKIDDLKVEEREIIRNQQRRDALVKLAPSLIQSIAKVDQIRAKEQYEIGQRILIDSGLTPDEEKQYLFADRSTQNVEGGVNKLLAKWKASGTITTETEENLRKLSGRKLLGAQKYYAQNAGKGVYQEQLRNWSIEYKHQFKDGRVLSLFDITERGLGDETDMATIRKIFDNKFYSQFGGSNRVLLTAEMKPWIDSHWELQNRSLSAVLDKQSVSKQRGQEREDFISTIHEQGGTNPASAFIRYINEQSGGLPELRGKIRAEAFRMLAEAVERGEITRETWEDIKFGYFTLDGQTTPSRIGKLYKDEALIVDAAVLKYEKKLLEERKTEEKIFDYKQKEAVFKFFQAEGRPMNIVEVKRLKGRYDKKGYEIPGWLKDYENQEELELSDQRIRLESLVANQTLSMAELVGTRRYSPALIDEFLEKAIDHPKSAPTKTVSRSSQAVANAIDDVLGDIKVSEARTDQSLLMSAHAEKMLVDNVYDGLAMGLYKDAATAWVQEANALVTQIKEGKGNFGLVTNDDDTPNLGPNGGFKYLKQELALDEKSILYRERVINDKTYIDKPDSFTQDDIKDIQQVEAGKDIPSWISTVSAQLGVAPYEVMNRILRANGEKEIEPAGLARVNNYVSPAFERLVMKNTSKAKTIDAVTETTKEMNPDVDEDEPVLELLKDKQAVNNGEYNYYEPIGGASNWFEEDLSITPIETVLENWRTGSGSVYGVYKIPGIAIQEAVDKGDLIGTDFFDKSTQETLKLMENESTGILKTNNNYAIPGVGQAWVTKEVTTNEALRTVLGDVALSLAKTVVKEPPIGGIAKVADYRQNMQAEAVKTVATVANTRHAMTKAVINKIKDPSTKEFFKRLGEGTADLFLQAILEVDEYMKNYTMNKRVRRQQTLDPKLIFSQKGINPHKLKPELFGEFAWQ